MALTPDQDHVRPAAKAEPPPANGTDARAPTAVDREYLDWVENQAPLNGGQRLGRLAAVALLVVTVLLIVAAVLLLFLR